MPDVYNDNVAKADVIHSWDGQLVENTLYFFSTVPITQANIQALADGLRSYWQTVMLPLMSSQVGFLVVETTHMTPVPALTGASAATVPNAGGDSNPASPNSTTLAVSFRTGVSGRSYRGRNYWIGLTEPNVVNSTVSTTLAAAVAAAYAGMIGLNSVADDWRWGVYSRRLNNADRETGMFNDVTSVVIVDHVVDSQRRRLPGRGR